MLRFLANNIDQLGIALQHIAKGNVNDERFGLMLTENIGSWRIATNVAQDGDI